MDMNEMANQLMSNPQIAAQVMQMMQQNGMASPNQGNAKQIMNWNMPTNPMATMWYYNLMNLMNNNTNNQNNAQPAQNQPNTQQPTSQVQQMDNSVSSVRVVKSQDEIKAEEIPMNDSISLFLQDDLSIIYGKRWTNNGGVDNMRFVLDRGDQINNISETPNMDVLFKKISEMIDEKLNQFKREISLDKCRSGKSRNNEKGVEDNGN